VDTHAAQDRRLAGFVAGAAGLAVLAVGAGFGVGAIGENNSSLSHCPGGRCDGTGASDSVQAVTDANVADVCVGVGIAAVGVATVLVLTGRTKSSSTAAARSGVTVAPSWTVDSYGLAGVF
jgi:hypothetical protein